MDQFNKMLSNSNVNNVATAFIFGYATYNFFNTVGQMLFGDLFNSLGQWVWRVFWTQLCVYVLLILVAWWVHTMAKN